MAFAVEEIKGFLTHGGARSSHFSIYLSNPINSSADFKTTFMAKAASLPPVEIGVVPFKYFGRDVKYAGDKTFPEWTVTVINDEDFIVRNALQDWSEAINGNSSNLREFGLKPANYKSQGQAVQWGKDGTPLCAYEFVGLWPSVVGEVEVNWDNENQIEEFPVTFQYDYWTKINAASFTKAVGL